jgi:predicted cupin superfamily sugar epimerase
MKPTTEEEAQEIAKDLSLTIQIEGEWYGETYTRTDINWKAVAKLIDKVKSAEKTKDNS